MIRKAKELLGDLIEENGLQNEDVTITVENLSVQQAIGQVDRDDLPLQQGEEILIQAEFKDSLGQAFTDSPREFAGSISDILTLDLEDDFNRPLFVATLNAIVNHLGRGEGFLHCRDSDLERCGGEMAARLREEFGDITIGLIGFQPVIIEGLAEEFGPASVRVIDLNPDNIGKRLAGVEIWSGDERTAELIEKSDLLLATGSTLANGSLAEIEDLVNQYGKNLYLYGTTIAGAADLLQLNRICPFGR